MASIHQISWKLREQIERFSGELCKASGVIEKRFVREMVYGILASGSVVLTKVARTLEEPITMHKTHDRLCRNLNRAGMAESIERAVLRQGAKEIREDTLIVIDPSDIIKPYARRMEHLADVRDGSAKLIGKGYWLCQAVAVEPGKSGIIPLACRLYSTIAPGFVSENDQILRMADDIMTATGYNGIVVMDRGGDRKRLLEPWTRHPLIRYIVRQRGDRDLLHGHRKVLAEEIARHCVRPYATTVTRSRDGEQCVFTVEYGYAPVRLPEAPERQLYLVVVSGFGKEPLMLLTTEPMRRHREVIWRIVEAYITRWRVEETIRFIKQSYEIEDVRVLTYRRMRNLFALVLAATHFLCVRIGLGERLKILAAHALSAARRLFGIPDFNCYSLADGIRSIFSRCGHAPITPRQNAPPDQRQLSLFPA